MEFFTNFSWAVPHAFSDAVALCRFEEGDILYDTTMAYEDKLIDACKYINYSLQVRYPVRVTTEQSKKSGRIFENNWDSEVRLVLYEKQQQKGVGQLKTTQGRLYTALWKGDISILNGSSKNPEIPLDVRKVTKLLQELKSKAIEFSNGLPVFVMVRDHSNQVSRDKYTKIYNKLHSYLQSEPQLYEPEFIGLKDWEQIAPTIEIAFFPVSDIDHKQLEALVKEAVYSPSPNSKKDMFLIAVHGAIFACK